MKKIIIAVAVASALVGCQKQSSTEAKSTVPSENKVHKVAAKAEVKAAGKSYDGPFGLDGSLPVAELERMSFKSSSTSPSVFTGSPPRPLEGTAEYFVVATPDSGICRIRAIVDVPITNGSGDQMKSRVDQFAETMQVKYGKHAAKVDYIGQDVYRRNPQYWMMGLKEESVIYAYDWSAGKTQQPLPEDMENIEISANATSSDAGYVAIQYTYKNFKNCTAEIKKQRAANL